MILFAFLSAPENVPRTTQHSTMVPTAENGWAGQNYGNFRNPAFDDLIDCLEVEPDREKRRAMWHDLQRLYAEDVPDLPLYFRSQAFIFPKWLKGIRPTGHQDGSTQWAEEWTIDE
jgi:peptide/nickel transport system substrate-binding protein